MPTTINKVSLNILTFLLFLHPLFNSLSELFFVIALVCFFFFSIIIKFKLPSLPPLYLSFLLSIVLIGILNGLLKGANRDFIRDVWLFTKPVCYIFLGAVLGARYKVNSQYFFNKIFKLIILAGLVSAVYHFIEIITVPGFAHLTFLEIRTLTRSTSLIEPFSLAFVIYFLFSNKLYVFPKFYLRIFLFVLALSVILFFSRTMLLVFFIYLGFMYNFFKLSWKAMSSFIVVALFLLYVFSLPKPTGDSSWDVFVNKIQRGTSELFYSNKGKMNMETITEDWRGYEAFRAINQTVQNGSAAIFLGNGFGSLVDLKITMPLGGKDYRYIPILHNGYAMLFFKTGILGVILYVLFLIMNYKKVREFRNLDEDLLMLKKLVLASIIVILITTPAITGIYSGNLYEPILLIMFFSISVLQQQPVEQKQVQTAQEMYAV
jgi:hypothetical protein